MKFTSRNSFLTHFRQKHYFELIDEESSSEDSSIDSNDELDDWDVPEPMPMDFETPLIDPLNVNNEIDEEYFRSSNFLFEKFTELEDDEFDVEAALGKTYLTNSFQIAAEQAKTQKVAAQLMTFYKANFQVASSVVNKIASSMLRLAVLIVKTKTDFLRHLEAAEKVCRSNFLQRKEIETDIRVVEHKKNDGTFYYIPLKNTLESICKIPRVQQLLIKDHSCKY